MKEVLGLKETIDQLDLKEYCRVFHPARMEYPTISILLSSMWKFLPNNPYFRPQRKSKQI
jgi:hypothetical protein